MAQPCLKSPATYLWVHGLAKVWPTPKELISFDFSCNGTEPYFFTETVSSTMTRVITPGHSQNFRCYQPFLKPCFNCMKRVLSSFSSRINEELPKVNTPMPMSQRFIPHSHRPVLSTGFKSLTFFTALIILILVRA